MVRQIHCGKKWNIDVSINFLRCLGDLGPHPCRVSDRHGSLSAYCFTDVTFLILSLL